VQGPLTERESPEGTAIVSSTAVPGALRAGGMDPLTLRLADGLEPAFEKEHLQQSLRHHRVVLLLGLAVFALFGILDRWTIPDAPPELLLIRYGIVCPVLLGALVFTFSPRFGRAAPVALTTAVAVMGLGLIVMSLIAPSPANHTFYVGLMLALVSVHMLVRVRFTYMALVTWAVVALYIVAVLWVDPLPPLIALNNSFFLVAANLVGMFAGYSIERHARTDFLQRLRIEAEQRRSEILLLNILPAPIVERLKRSPGTVADSFPEVTVLFADIVAFAPLADHLPPAQLVTLLNDVFSAFDRVAGRYGLEKIKTMGDCYMVVGGLPVPLPDHAEAVAEAALDMLAALAELNARRTPPLELRIGIHTGPVVAGVIGTRKFSYDLWGDTVNTASRMESHGLPGCVQVSRATYARLRGRYVIEERGVVNVKGKGQMDTFLLVGRRPEPIQEGTAADGRR